MQGNETHEADPQASGSDQDPHHEFKLNATLRAKLDNLAQWRLDPSLIEFPGDAQEFRGGYATVSRAHLASPSGGQRSEPKVVAVKMPKVERDADLERILGLALRESKFVVELSHPNVAKLEGFVEDASKHVIWLVFPWEENGNLRDFLASGEWGIPERISLIDDVVSGVEYLHSQTPLIYHGDLKSRDLGSLQQAPHRTGTLPFMAIGLLEEPKSEHRIGFDVEALIWTLLWIVRLYDNGKAADIPLNDHPLKNWFLFPESLKTLAASKTQYLSNSFKHRFTNTFYHSLEKDMEDLAWEWWNMLGQQTKERHEQLYGEEGADKIQAWMVERKWNE